VTNPINRKLRPEDIQEIRRAYAAGEASLSVLGRRYRVSRQHIHRVLDGVKPPRHVSMGQDTHGQGGQDIHGSFGGQKGAGDQQRGLALVKGKPDQT